MAIFEKFLPILKSNEGGFQAQTTDTGNYNSKKELIGTNHGISAKVLEAYLKRVPTVSDMKLLTWETATKIYRVNYWNAIQGDKIQNQSVAEIIADHAVNAGVGSAVRILQKVLNSHFGKSLKVDGSLGEQTLTALNSVNQELLHQHYKQARIDYYKSLKNSTYERGWLVRANRFFFQKR